MNSTKQRLMTLLLAFLMIITSLPVNVLAASGVSGDKKEITDIKTVGDKQVINLGEVQGKSSFRFFSRSARPYSARTQQAGGSNETVAQKVEINLATMGLNLEEDQFDPSALTEVGSFDVEITFKELGGTRTETRTMTFQAGETKKTETFYLPKDFGNGNVEAEIPKLKENIALRVYVSGNSTTNFNLGQDMTYKFELSQIVHPIIDLKVVDPYGKELQENINQALVLKLTLADKHEFDLPANTKTFNIRTLDDFAGDNIEDLNSTGDNLTLSLTTALDKDKRLKVGDKTYKLNKITYNALGQEVEINGQKKKVGGYIEFATQPKIIVPTPDDSGNLPKTPDGYKRLSFHAETKANANDGRFKQGEKLKVIDVIEGTEFKDTKLLAEIAKVENPTPLLNGNPDDNKKFLKWNPAIPTAETEGHVADTDYYPVYLKDGGEITPGEKLPDGVFEVKVIKDDTIAADPLYGKSYGVFQGSKLARDKFPDLEAAKGHQNPKWTTEADAPATGMVDIVKPWTKVITKATTFKATAAEKAATQIKKEGLKAVDTTALQGQELTEEFWHKGVALADNTPADKKDAFAALLKEATVTDKSSRTTAEAGDKVGTLLVTFKDGSTLEVPNQKLIVKPNTVEISFDNEANDDANAPRHKETVVKGKVKSTSGYPVKGAVVEIKDEAGKVIGITKVIDDEGNFTAGTRELKAGEKLTASVTLPDSKLAAESTPKTVKLNADRLKDLLPIAKTQKDNFSKKQNAFTQEKLNNLNTAITNAEKLVDEKGKAKGDDTAKNQTAIDNAVKALEEALKALTANIPPTISGPKTHEIFVGEDLDLKKLVDVTDGDGADDLVEVEGSKVQVKAVKVEGQTETSVEKLSTIKDTVGTYKVTYTAKDNSGAEVTHEMTLTVKPRTTSAIEVTKDPTKMSYLITEKDGKAKLNLDGMTLNLVDNLGKKTEVKLNNPNLKLKVNGREVTNGADLTLADDVKFIEVEYTPEGSQTPLKAQTKGVLRVGPDYDNDGTDDRTQNFDPDKIEKLEVIKQPQLDYIAKDKSEAEKVFKLNLEGMIVRMTDKAGKEKLALVKNGMFYDYDKQTKEITQLTATPAHGAKLTPETAENVKGDNGKTVEIKSTNGKTANTEPLKVFYDANKDGKPDYGKDQKTPAPSAMARNVGENPKGTTVEGMATPGAVIKITDKDGTVLTTDPKEVVAGPDGKYTATIKPMLADGTDIKVTAKLGEMGESDPTPTTVFDDKNNNKQPDRDEGFNIAKATDIKFVDQPDLTYLVPSKDKEVTFDGKDGKGKAIYLELSYKNGDKTESKIMTLEDLMKDTEHIAVTPAKGTTDKKENQAHDLVGKNLEVKLVKADKTATSTSTFAIEIDADKNGKADKDEKTPAPTAKALNVGKDPKSTTITGAAVPGAKVVAKVGETVVGEATVPTEGENAGKYTIEAKKDGVALPVDTKVEVTAQVGEKQPSDPTEAIVKEDKDGNGTPDNEQGFDITKAAKIEMVSDPNKMDYLVTTQDGTVKFEANGMLVRVTDKAGKEKLYTAAELTADTTNFTVEPAHNSDLTIKANHGKKVKVTLKTAPADMTTKEVETSRALSIKLDANNNGVPDDQEVFDITKATKVEIIHNPDKMDYLVKSNEDKDKVPFETKGLMIRLTDASGKTATYTAEDLEKDGIKDKFTLSPAKDDKLGLTSEGKTNSMDFTVTVTGATEKPNVKADRQVIVKLDADGNGTADEDEKSKPAEDVKALNQNKVVDGKVTNEPKDTTTVTGKAPKGSTVIIKDETGNQIGKVDKVGDDGIFTAEVTKQEVGKKVKVIVTEPGKQDSDPVEAKVVRDSDNDGQDDTQAGQTERPAAIASNKGKTPTFTTIEGKTEKGATITVTVKVNGKEKPVTVENLKVNDDGTYTLEAKYENKALENGAEILVYAENAPKKISKPQTTTVFNDFNEDGKPDGGKVDLDKIKDIQVIDPKKMTYVEGTDGKLNLTGLKVVVRDTLGGMQIFDYNTRDNKFKDGDTALDGFTVKVGDKEVKQDTDLTSADHNNKKIIVSHGKTTGETVQALKVTKTLLAPEVDDVKKGDTTVKVKVPTNGETKITVKVGDKEVVVEKDPQDGQWKVGNKPVNTVDGKLQIPVDELKQGDVVKVTTEDAAGNKGETEKQVPVDEYSAKPTDLKAKNEPATPDKTTVTGKATPGAVITIQDKDGKVLTTEPKEVKSDGDGNFTATIDKKDPNTLLLVTAKEEGKEPSADVPTQVEGSSDVVPVDPNQGGKDKPEGFVTVTFAIKDADKAKGSLEGGTAYYVNPKVDVQLNPPTFKAETGFKLDGWDQAGKLILDAKKYTVDTTINAVIGEVADVVPGKDPNTGKDNEKPAGYVEIAFAVDKSKGKFADKAETKFFVNPKKEIKLTAPEVTVTDLTYTFEGWDNANWNGKDFDTAKYETDTLITAKLKGSTVEKPKVDNVTTGDTTVNVNPGDADKVTVVVEGQGTVVVKKDSNDGNKWKTPDGKVVTPDNDGKLPVPVQPIGEKALVEVTVEKDGVVSEKVSTTAQKVLALLVETLSEDEQGITVTTNPRGAKVSVYYKDKLIKETVTDGLGVATIILDKPMVAGQSYKVKAELDGYLPKENTVDVVGKTK